MSYRLFSITILCFSLSELAGCGSNPTDNTLPTTNVPDATVQQDGSTPPSTDAGANPPSDAGPPNEEWAIVGTAANDEFWQSLRIATNSRGDAAMVWEWYSGRLKATSYSASSRSWSGIVTIESSEAILTQPVVRVFPDGEALLVWLEVQRSGAAMKLREARSDGTSWGMPTDIGTLESDVSYGISSLSLEINDAGQAAVAWQSVSTEGGVLTHTFVATRDASGWHMRQLTGAGVGPAKIALDEDGVLLALHGARLTPDASAPSVLATTYDFESDTWQEPAVVGGGSSLYACSDASPACYAISTGAHGTFVALLWDAIGDFSGLGSIRAYARTTSGWQETSDSPLSVSTTTPVLKSDAAGNAMALYASRDEGGRLQLESRQLDTASGNWGSAQTLADYTLQDAQMNASGDVVVLGTNPSLVPSVTTTHTGTDWQTPELVDDTEQCTSRHIQTAIDDEGVVLVGQLCIGGDGSFPFFLRAKHFTLR